MSLQKESEWKEEFDKHFWGVTKLGKHPQGWEIIDGPMEELMKDVKSFIENLLEQERKWMSDEIENLALSTVGDSEATRKQILAIINK